MSLWTWLFGSKEAKEQLRLQHEAEKKEELTDRKSIRKTVERLENMIDELQHVQERSVNEINTIKDLHKDFNNIFMAKGVPIKFEFAIFTRKKSGGFVRVKVTPKEWADKFSQLVMQLKTPSN